MDGQNLQLVSEKAECLHSSMTVASPEGLRTYGLPVDTDNCLECGWRSFEQAVGKHVEMPPVQIVWWPTEDESAGNWVAECFSWEPAPGDPSVLGRGKTVGAAVHDLAAKIRASLQDQPQ